MIPKTEEDDHGAGDDSTVSSFAIYGAVLLHRHSIQNKVLWIRAYSHSHIPKLPFQFCTEHGKAEEEAKEEVP